MTNSQTSPATVIVQLIIMNYYTIKGMILWQKHGNKKTDRG